MNQATVGDLRRLLEDHEAPCISLYIPRNRSYPESQQDPIRYRNMLREVERTLRQKHPVREFEPVLAKLRGFADDENFWIHATDGLAMFASPDYFAYFRLQRAVPERLIVADTFHTKPLVRILQSAERYQILAVTLAQVKLFEGNRDVLDQIEVDGVPKTIKEALGDQLTDGYSSVSTHAAGTGGPAGIFYGQGSRKDEVEIDRDRFFRVVDRAVLEHVSRPSGLPLILACLSEHQTHFRRISHNPFLLPQGIAKNPDALPLDELRVEAWAKIEPLYLERLERLKSAYMEAKAHGRGTDDLEQVPEAIVQGRVGQLLVEAERSIPGRVDLSTGRVETGDLDDPADDLLDDIAESVLRTGGEVVVVPRDRMPTDTGLAATYRF